MNTVNLKKDKANCKKDETYALKEHRNGAGKKREKKKKRNGVEMCLCLKSCPLNPRTWLQTNAPVFINFQGPVLLGLSFKFSLLHQIHTACLQLLTQHLLPPTQ